MKQIIPFVKDITFKTKIGELTSISLDNDLTLKGEDMITGSFYIKGTYKMLKTSEIENEYSYKIPCDIAISDEYDAYDAKIDIDDFNYEIINEEILRVKISLVIDNLERKEKEEKIEVLNLDNNAKDEEIINEREEKESFVKQETDDVDKVEKSEKFEKVGSIEKRCIEEETEEELEKRDNYSTKESINPIDVITKKETLEKEETYMTYSVYLVRENDTIDKICEKYNVTKQDLEDYNDINSVTPGIKLIIPNLNE